MSSKEGHTGAFFEENDTATNDANQGDEYEPRVDIPRRPTYAATASPTKKSVDDVDDTKEVLRRPTYAPENLRAMASKAVDDTKEVLRRPTYAPENLGAFLEGVDVNIDDDEEEEEDDSEDDEGGDVFDSNPSGPSFGSTKDAGDENNGDEDMDSNLPRRPTFAFSSLLPRRPTFAGRKDKDKDEKDDVGGEIDKNLPRRPTFAFGNIIPSRASLFGGSNAPDDDDDDDDDLDESALSAALEARFSDNTNDGNKGDDTKDNGAIEKDLPRRPTFAMNLLPRRPTFAMNLLPRRPTMARPSSKATTNTSSTTENNDRATTDIVDKAAPTTGLRQRAVPGVPSSTDAPAKSNDDRGNSDPSKEKGLQVTTGSWMSLVGRALVLGLGGYAIYYWYQAMKP